MQADRHRNLVIVVAALAALVAAGALLFWLAAPGVASDGPAPIAWDRVICSHCRMHVGEPQFAAQLRDEFGDLQVFDDPGCLFAWRAQHPEPVRGVYFHAFLGDGWLAEDDVAFEAHEPTPMGYGLAAVPKGTPDGLGLEQARELLQGRGLLAKPTSPSSPAEAQR